MGLLCSPCMPRPAYRLCMPFLHLNWYRADNVCDDENRMEEISHLRKTFLGNGYPRGLIERIVNKSPYVPQDICRAPAGALQISFGGDTETLQEPGHKSI